jgi:hypothetical protein
MLARTLAALVLLLAACPAKPTMKGPPPGGGDGSAAGGGSAMGSADPADPSGGGSGSATADPRPPGPKLGEPCGSGDACGEGSCVSYRGIAGARGPEFKTCELRCDQGACRDGRTCITIADGPGQVCR